jgi:hypothetical protein
MEVQFLNELGRQLFGGIEKGEKSLVQVPFRRFLFPEEYKYNCSSGKKNLQ